LGRPVRSSVYRVPTLLGLGALVVLSLVGSLPPGVSTGFQVTRHAFPQTLARPSPDVTSRITDAYGRLPLSFEANRGQADDQVDAVSRGRGFTLSLTPSEAVLNLSAPLARTGDANPERNPPTVLTLRLTGGNPHARAVAGRELPGTANYFIGNDPARWRTGIPTFAEIRYENVYPGIDLTYYGNQGRLEYDFVVAAGANPDSIALEIIGADKLEVNAQGELVLHTKAGEIRQPQPVVYQEVAGIRQVIPAGYVLSGSNRVGFSIAAHDSGKPLVIDPTIVYSTYLGGNNTDVAQGIAVDASGAAYVTGYTYSTNFPTTPGAFQTIFGGGADAFVTKLNPAGNALVYSTYLGGNSLDVAQGIAVDASGAAYVTGYTYSTNFPTTPGTFQTIFGGVYDAFVTKLNPAGNALVYSTFLGGSNFDVGQGIAVDALGDAYVTGYTLSTNFPTTPGSFQTTSGGGTDAFVAKLNPAGNAPVYSTFLAGSSADVGQGIAVDASGAAYVTGYTLSTNFPTTPGAFQTIFGGVFDAFVTKLNPAGNALVYSTYVGGSGFEVGYGIAVDASGAAYVTGQTDSTNFPTTPGAFQTTSGGGYDAFVTKLNPAGSALVYSTFLGGSSTDVGQGIAMDGLGDAYVTGATDSTNFPTTPGAFQTTLGGGYDALVTKLNPAGNALVYSTFLGGSSTDAGQGIAVDGLGDAYVTGSTDSTNFPTTPGAFQTTLGGSYDAFVTKIADKHSTTTSVICSPPSVPVNSSTTCTATVSDTSVSPTTPTGTVSFSSSGTGTFSGSPCTLGLGQCSVTYTPTGVGTGTHTITATYAGDATHAPSSGTTTITVTKRSTSTTVSCVPPTVSVGNATTCTATVNDTDTGTASMPTGTVSFASSGAGAFSGSPCTLVSGQCSVTYTPSAVGTGTHLITATYSGDATHATSSGTTTVTVTTRTTSTTVSCVPSTVSVGNATACLATVKDTDTGIALTPTGMVTFTSSGAGAFSGSPCTLAAGQCSVTYTPSAVGIGTHTITATYGGDSSHSPSSGTTPVTVTTRSTSTTVSCAPSTVSVGNASTCTATVKDTDTGISSTPTGTVSFSSSGAGTFGGSPCALVSGQCSVTYTPTAVGTGTHTITATYNGDAAHASSSGTTTVTVTTRTTSTTVSCVPSTVSVGNATTCTATVKDTDTGISSTPTGTVGFSSSGTGTFGGSPCTLVAGQCSVSYTPSAVGTGTHTITAGYSGDSSYAPSSGSTTVTVTTRSTLTTVSCVPPTVSVGNTTTCTATVKDIDTGISSTPTGTVSFSSSGTGTFSGSPCTLVSGQCSVTYTATTVGTGTHLITAVYSGDTAHSTSSGTTPLTVITRSTSTTVSCVPSTVSVGNATTCTATVKDTDTGISSTPTGTVSFASSGLGTFSGSPCTLVAGQCSVTYTPSAVGTHTITATYSGDGSHSPSSGSTTVTVTTRTTSTTVSCVPASVSVGNATTCTATVKDTDTGISSTPTGTVSFTSSGLGTFSGAGVCTLAAGQCSVTYTPAAVGTGTHTITATYSGDAAHASSSGSTTVTVTKRSTSTTVSCVPSTVSVGSPTVCTATVKDTDTGISSTPTGTVSFASSGPGTFVGSPCTLAAGQCSVTYTPSAAGTHTITATYSGDAIHAPSSGTTPVTVTAATCQEADGNGDFQNQNGQHGDFQMDNDNCEESGHGGNGDTAQGDHVDSSNRGDGKDFHSTKIESTKFDAKAHTVTITGLGTSNGKQVAFTLVALETGNGGPGWVSLVFSDGYSIAGNLLNGSITLH
jgi:Big-like domain-containing protein/beta-propeller repeat-containing protein